MFIGPLGLKVTVFLAHFWFGLDCTDFKLSHGNFGKIEMLMEVKIN